MKHIYKILLILILIITIAIYFYTNRYEMHTFEVNGGTRIIIIKKWSGETFFCCGLQLKWKNLGIPKEPSFTEMKGSYL